MSTATVNPKQTQEERDRVIAAWDSSKGTLAETQKNLQIMREALVGYQKKYGEFLSVDILNAIVKANAHQLDWLAQAPKPTLKKGDTFQRLAEVGVLKSSHLSVAEKEEAGKRAQNTQKAIVDWATMHIERHTLISELRQSQSITIQHKLGMIDHRRTGEARQAALAVVKAKIAHFNSKVASDDLKIST